MQEAYACIIHSVVLDQHILHAISKSCMHVVTAVRTSMHSHVHACMYGLGVQRVNVQISEALLTFIKRL